MKIWMSAKAAKAAPTSLRSASAARSTSLTAERPEWLCDTPAAAIRAATAITQIVNGRRSGSRPERDSIGSALSQPAKPTAPGAA